MFTRKWDIDLIQSVLESCDPPLSIYKFFVRNFFRQHARNFYQSYEQLSFCSWFPLIKPDVGIVASGVWMTFWEPETKSQDVLEHFRTPNQAHILSRSLSRVLRWKLSRLKFSHFGDSAKMRQPFKSCFCVPYVWWSIIFKRIWKFKHFCTSHKKFKLKDQTYLTESRFNCIPS